MGRTDKRNDAAPREVLSSDDAACSGSDVTVPGSTLKTGKILPSDVVEHVREQSDSSASSLPKKRMLVANVASPEEFANKELHPR